MLLELQSCNSPMLPIGVPHIRLWGKACGCHLFKNGVAEPGHPSLLIHRAGHAVTSLTGALPGERTYYTRTSQEILGLDQPWVCLQPNQSFPHPTAINEMLFKLTIRLYETLMCIPCTCPHSPLAFRGYSPWILANSHFHGAVQLLASQQVCEPKHPPWLTFIK